MEDRRLDEVSAATNFSYAYTEDSSNNQVKISKADMASVLADIINPFKISHLKENTQYDLNNIGIGLYWTESSSIVRNITNTPLDSNLGGDLVVISAAIKYDGRISIGFQICFQENGASNGVYIRMARYYQSVFSSWVKIA